MRGAQKLVGGSGCPDMDVARRLWAISAERSGVPFPLGAAAGAQT